MTRINSRNKGANGEREAAIWLQQQFKLEHRPERNLEQVRKGGHDLLGFVPFAVEVKRSQTLDKRNWWLQAVTSCVDEYNVPVVMYRPNNQPWRFLIAAKNIGLKTGYIQLEQREFVLWGNNLIARLDRVAHQADISPSL